MSPNHEIHHDSMHARHLDLLQSFSYGFPGGPARIHWSRTTYSCSTNSAISNEHINPEISMKIRPNVTHSFLGSGPAIFPASVISSHACIVFLSEASSSSHLGILILQLGALPLVEGGRCEALSSFWCTWKNATKIIKNQLIRNSPMIILEHSETLQDISNDS